MEQAYTARATCSSLKAHKSSSEPPPRPRIITSQARWRSSWRKAATICPGAWLPWTSTGLRVLLKLLLLPVVMGISYEVLKWCGRSDSLFSRIVRQPGLWVQRLTVFEPDDSMIEVAIEAVRPVLPDRPEEGRW